MFLAIAQYMRTLVKRSTTEESGQSMVEYALILSVISIAAVAAMLLLGPAITGAIDAVTASF